MVRLGALDERRFDSKSPSRVRVRDKGVTGRKEVSAPMNGNWFFTYFRPNNLMLATCLRQDQAIDIALLWERNQLPVVHCLSSMRGWLMPDLLRGWVYKPAHVWSRCIRKWGWKSVGSPWQCWEGTRCRNHLQETDLKNKEIIFNWLNGKAELKTPASFSPSTLMTMERLLVWTPSLTKQVYFPESSTWTLSSDQTELWKHSPCAITQIETSVKAAWNWLLMKKNTSRSI